MRAFGRLGRLPLAVALAPVAALPTAVERPLRPGEAANILPYSPHGAMVAFVFRTPYTDLGTYKLRVVYAPQDGPKVERARAYKWRPKGPSRAPAR